MGFCRGISCCMLALACLLTTQPGAQAQETVGVLFIVHGGFDQYSEQNLFDSSVQLFAVRPDHPVHSYVLWNKGSWGSILQVGNAQKEIGKYSFNYGRLGGTDPFHTLTDNQLAQLEAELNAQAPAGTTFVVDYASWMAGDRPWQYPYPRFLYNPPDWIEPSGFLPADDISELIYCGEDEAGGPWPGCDPHRFDVDGPAERFIDAGVDRIVSVDMTTGGVRFFKTWDVLWLLKRALADNGRSDIPVIWLNDPGNLMDRSLPVDPVGVTGGYNSDLRDIIEDVSVPLASNPNPVIEDIELAELHVEAIEANMVVDAEATTGIMLLNHATRDWDQYWDPKIDDTVVINKNIKNLLLSRYPAMDPDNIVGAWMGVMESGTAEEGPAGKERTRRMRGENLGHAWLYEQPNGTLPGDEWGYLYWEALEYLKNRGVTHIVIGFPQIVANSVLNLVEIHNQIGKELGKKNWLYWDTPDYTTYPGVGHPFADYWGIWVNTDCGGVPCCFEMGGCEDDRPYPPARQTTGARDDMDPSLAYDLSDYGHLGYDETGASGAVSPDGPVQDQYTGTWAMYSPPNDDPRLAALLAKHVLTAIETREELARFAALGLVKNVLVTWTTASGSDNDEFNVLRADSPDGEYVIINTRQISAKGNRDRGHTYWYLDRRLKRGDTYYYKIETINLDGTSTMHGPVSATPGLLNLFR